MNTIIITGKDIDGRIVASERVTDSRKAVWIADYWRGSGLEVETAEST